jgi:hypothetical protein
MPYKTLIVAIFMQLGGCKALLADKQCIEMYYKGVR